MNYEAWRMTYQDSEQAARAAYRMYQEARQPQERGEAVAYLCDGMRFKVGHFPQIGVAILNLPLALNGQWVALVDATDNKHMSAHPPADAQRIAELEALYNRLGDEYETAVAMLAMGASDGTTFERIAALEAQLTESRGQVWEFAERLTATRRALCDVRLKTREGSIVWKIADAALAADKEQM